MKNWAKPHNGKIAMVTNQMRLIVTQQLISKGAIHIYTYIMNKPTGDT